MNDIKTGDTLLKRLSAAASKTLTADEVSRQKISFIMGSLGEKSTITKAQVQSVLAKQDGEKTAA